MDNWGTNARLARTALSMGSTSGVPSGGLNLMDIPLLEAWARCSPGAYRAEPERVYLAFQQAIGACFIDQFIPRNPLTMSAHGYETDSVTCGPTTGASEIRADGMVIDGPEAVARHLQEVVLPRLRAQIEQFDEGEQYAVTRLIEAERLLQKRFGNDLLKVPYGGFQAFPRLRYGQYGYHHYFCAYALYPELMAEDFRLQADLAVLQNRRSARAIVEGELPAVVRLDHDMADSRGTLVDVRSLDEIWFPQFARAIEPLLAAGVRLLWHCDGNLMAMVPRLLEVGIGGFQGFQYEDGMDYEQICGLKDREGNPLMIWAGVSVTTTLPLGTPTQVRDQLRWLVRHGPPVGLVLGASSSITPGIPAENLATLVEGLAYYRDHR
jgi:hypothetical protein